LENLYQYLEKSSPSNNNSIPNASSEPKQTNATKPRLVLQMNNNAEEDDDDDSKHDDGKSLKYFKNLSIRQIRKSLGNFPQNSRDPKQCTKNIKYGKLAKDMAEQATKIFKKRKLSKKAQLSNSSKIIQHTEIPLFKPIPSELILSPSTTTDAHSEFPENQNIVSKSFNLNYSNTNFTKEQLFNFLKTIKNPTSIVVVIEKKENANITQHAYVLYDERKHFTNAQIFTFCGIMPIMRSCKNPEDVLQYVLGPDNYISTGLDVMEKITCMRNKRKYFAKQLILGKSLYQTTMENPELLFDYGKLAANLRLFKNSGENNIGDKLQKKCYWIYGKPGIGKSTWVRNHVPADKIFWKDSNRWWDFYNDQEAILIDDLSGPDMGKLLKTWTDNFTFYGETKGGVIAPKFNTVYVTTNYLPHELWNDRKLVEAIKRRFIFKTIDEHYELIDFDYE